VLSCDNVLSFLSMNLARPASSATQLSLIRRRLGSGWALMQAGGQPAKLAGPHPAAWAIAPAGAAFATAAPPAATHASAVLTGSDCLAAFGGHQAPKLPECLGD
jgi:hypothetical protein